MTRTRFQSIMQNPHFSNNNNDDKTDKLNKIHPVIRHLNKPIKWGFKYWYRCDSEAGYVYQLELYQGRKEKKELNLGLSVVLDSCEILKDSYCHVFFDNFFNSSTQYGLGTACSNRINMPQIKKDKEMKQ